jgi:hypothetical protein
MPAFAYEMSGKRLVTMGYVAASAPGGPPAEATAPVDRVEEAIPGA